MASITGAANRAPDWLRTTDRLFRLAIMWVSCTLVVLMVVFTVYTVVMRYVFSDAPFWGDTLALFCNIWLVLISYALAVRDREDIATEGIYIYFSPRAVVAFRFAWQTMTLMFAVFLFWFGLDAALNVPGHYWELGGIPKKIPMMILPLSGLLLALVAATNLSEDIFGWRAASNEER